MGSENHTFGGGDARSCCSRIIPSAQFEEKDSGGSSRGSGSAIVSLPLEQLYKAIGRVYPLSRRLLALVVLFILSFGALVVLADSEVQAKEHDGFSPQNPQQPPPIKTVGAVEETAATGRSPTESTPVKPLPSSEETQVTPPAGPAPPTVPPPATKPQPEPAPPPGPP